MKIPKGNISQDDIIKQLGISRAEAQALDKYDGKEGDGIKKDIFTQAKEALENAKKTDDEDSALFYLANLPAAVKLLSKTIAAKLGLDTYFFNNNKSMTAENLNEAAETFDNNEGFIKPCEEDILTYLHEHGSLEGFTFTNIPNGVKNIRITSKKLYDDSRNDIATVDKNGNAVIKEVIDGIAIEIHFTKDNEEYTLGFIDREE